MNRFEQRLHRRLQHPEIVAGFRGQTAERELLQRLEQAREQVHISKKALATRLGKHREVGSRLLQAPDATLTLETLVELLMALGITADITLRLATGGEGPLKVAIVL